MLEADEARIGDVRKAAPAGLVTVELWTAPAHLADRLLFAQRERLFAFFGAVIGLAGDPDLGYTRLDGSFWTIDFGGGLEPALRGTATLFEDLSGGSIGFTVETQAVAAELPGNDWSVSPDGEAYLALLPGVDTDAQRQEPSTVR